MVKRLLINLIIAPVLIPVHGIRALGSCFSLAADKKEAPENRSVGQIILFLFVFTGIAAAGVLHTAFSVFQVPVWGGFVCAAIASVLHILIYVIEDYKIKQKDPDDKIWNYRGNACNQITATFACLIYILTTIAYFNSGHII